MESIVSPWIIYLIFMVTNFKAIFIIVGAMIGVIGLPIYIDAGKHKVGYLMWTICIVMLTIGFLIPTKATVIGMVTANEITYDRADKAVEIGKDIKDSIKKDIIDIIQEITKEDSH